MTLLMIAAIPSNRTDNEILSENYSNIVNI